MLPAIKLDSPGSPQGHMKHKSSSHFHVFEEKIGEEKQISKLNSSRLKLPDADLVKENVSYTPSPQFSKKWKRENGNKLSPFALDKYQTFHGSPDKHKSRSPFQELKHGTFENRDTSPLPARSFQKNLVQRENVIKGICPQPVKKERHPVQSSPTHENAITCHLYDAFVESIDERTTPKTDHIKYDSSLKPSPCKNLFERKSALLTSSPKPSFKPLSPVEQDLPSLSSDKGSSNSSSGSGTGRSSGDHLLNMLDMVVDLSPVPHLAESIIYQSPGFPMSNATSSYSSYPVVTSSVDGSKINSRGDYLDLTGNVEETSVVTLSFPNQSDSCCSVRVVRSESISLKAVQQSEILVSNLLGSGGFGKVFLAKWFDMTLAIKILSGKVIGAKGAQNSGSTWQDCYASEKSILNLKHPNLVRTLAMSLRQVYPEEPVYIFMEYVGDRNLLKVLESPVEEFTSPRLLRFIKHISLGLQYIHSNGIIHMDIKPANIFITSRDVCKVGDFGCCLSARRTPLATPHPQMGQISLHIPGTPAYTAPELFCGLQPSKKSDMYSLAICFWQLLTRGLDPYPGLKQPHVLIYCVVKFTRRPTWDEGLFWLDNKHFQRELVTITELNWDKDPESRQTPKEILKFIKRWRKKL